MQRLGKLSKRMRLTIAIPGAFLLTLVSSLNCPARGQENGIYPAARINCGNPPPADLLAIEVPTGLQTFAEHCQVQVAIQQQQSDSTHWGSSYRLGTYICRDRADVNTVCVTPSAAVRLRWDIPSQ
jgi:hypothetical protein